jgi:hypothetical protein
MRASAQVPSSTVYLPCAQIGNEGVSSLLCGSAEYALQGLCAGDGVRDRCTIPGRLSFSAVGLSIETWMIS